MERTKTRKQLMQEKIIDWLQNGFYVTDAELVAPVLDPHWLSPKDIAQPMQQKCGVFLPEREYQNWGEFVRVMTIAACRQRVKF